ncbi:uncharacterized protein LOC132703581 [Cylas formicarius]|uniref:uncharacterized protein LOC132703581 n=1 Tax=Cylas formicarius TaxID=197179 RepID=UPI0029588294|nr:uncharacterized protein LOC132703581 [Cylas formicarius]
MKKPNKFNPKKTPRYLPGCIPQQASDDDLRRYNQHLYRIFSAKAVVDACPPRMNPFCYLNSRKLHQDATRLREIDTDNKKLLKKISIINRTGGRVDSYNPDAYRRIDKWPAYNRKMKSVEVENRKIYTSLQTVQQHYDNERLRAEWRETLKTIKHSCRYPLVILAKASLDETLKKELSISYLLGDYFVGPRTRCFLEFSVLGGKRLGKIVIEVYEDRLPVTAKNFVELCKGDTLSYKNNLVHRITKGQYMEMGDIIYNNGRGGRSVYGDSFPQEGHRLRHTKAGVVSMKRVGRQLNHSQFCITFCKMERLDFKNVVFGYVVEGNDVLVVINNYGRKIGKPLERIFVSDCGVCSNTNSIEK